MRKFFNNPNGRQLSNRTSESAEQRSQSKPLTYAFNRLLITFSYAILTGLSVSLIVRAFTVSVEAGVKSLAAAALPPIIITYAALSSRSSFQVSERLSGVRIFILAALWMIVLMIVADFVDSYTNYFIPLGVLITSLTFSVLVLLARHLPFAALLSCSYGIISGLLLYTLIFGFSWH